MSDADFADQNWQEWAAGRKSYFVQVRGRQPVLGRDGIRVYGAGVMGRKDMDVVLEWGRGDIPHLCRVFSRGWFSTD